jgi:translocation and assembly module TamB
MSSKPVRWIKRILLGTLGLVVVVVATALIVLHTDWGRGIVRSQVEARLNQMIVGGAKVGKIEGSALGELTVHDVVLNGPDKKPAISIKKLKLRLGIAPLLSNQVRIGGLVAEDVDVDLRRDPDGVLQITRLTRPGPKSNWSIEIPTITVHRAHVRFDPGSGQELVNLDGIEIVGAAKIPANGPLDASIDLEAMWRERKAPIVVTTEVHKDPEVISVPTLVASVGAVKLTGTDIKVSGGENPVVGGSITLDAPRAELEKLVPGLQAYDIALQLQAEPITDEGRTRVTLNASIDQQKLSLFTTAHIGKKQAAGVLTTGMLDLTKLSRGKIKGTGTTFATFDVQPGLPGQFPYADALILASADLDEFPHADVAVRLSTNGEHVIASVGAVNPGMTATVSGIIHKVGEKISLEGGRIIAHTRDPEAASGGKAPVHGRIDVDLTASGAVLPQPSLAVAGTIEGSKLRVQDLTVQSLKLAIDARRLPARPLGRLELKAEGIQRQNVYLSELSLTAADRKDQKIQVSLRTRPRQNPWLFEADALVTLGKTVTVDLQRHHLRAGSGADWRGRSGRVVIAPQRIDVRDLKSVTDGGELAIAGAFYRVNGGGRRAGDLDAKVDATHIALDNLGKGYAGTVEAHVDLARRNGILAGSANVDAKGVVFDPKIVMFDAGLKVTAGAGKVAVAANASTATSGKASLQLDLDAPRDIADVAAWRRSGRSVIRTGQIKLERLDIGQLADKAGQKGYKGTIDGDIRVSATTTGGVIRVRDFVAPALRGTGVVSADLQISQPTPNELMPTLTARIDNIGAIDAQARFGMPDKLFDPAAWKNLGRGALRGASIRAQNIQIDPALLDRFDIRTQMRGKVGFVAEVTEAARSAKLAVAVRSLRGAPIVQPLDIDFNAAIDDKATTTGILVRTRPERRVNRQIVVGAPISIVEVKGNLPLTLAQLEADPQAVRDLPLAVTATVPNVPAKEIVAIFGRSQITGGTVGGKIELTGTVGKPLVSANLAGTMIEVPPGPGGKPIKTIDKIVIEGSWDGTIANAKIEGTQQKGFMRLVAKADPNALDEATATLEAKQFDLVPLLAFAPGPAGGGAGRLDAKLTVKGFNTKAQVRGALHLADARLPIAPQVGTLRRAKIDIIAGEHAIDLKADGRLGHGTVKATAKLAVDGARPTGGEAKLILRKISPIGVVEPIIDADVTTKLRRVDDQWIADVDIKKGVIVVPDDRGEKLKPAGAPPDMVFMTGERLTRRPMEKAPPARPLLIANVTLGPTHIISDEMRGLVKGKLTLTSDADSVGIVGTIDAYRGDLDLFGHRYRVERAMVTFDGKPDPLLDIRITHDFPEVTTITQVRGRVSKPEIIMTSDPAIYSQGQLLGFLLGGEPDGEPGNARDRATNAGTSFVAGQIAGYVKGALPIDLDVLKYESASSTSSAAITVGTWLTRNLFVAYRQHLEARPDENAGEGEIEYWFTRRVLIEGIVGDRGYNGVDLLWRKRY